MTTCKTTASVGVHGNAGNKSVKKQLLWNGNGHNNYKQLQKNTKNLFGRIRPGSPTISYRGVAQLVARLLWEQEARGSSPRTPTTFHRKTACLGGFSAFLV